MEISSAPPPLIGVIAGTKASDALQCRVLEEAGFSLRIVHARIPVRAWIPWIWKRVCERGISTLIGHLLLAVWLRAERIVNHLCKKSVWRTAGIPTPSWKQVASPRISCWTDKHLLRTLEHTDLIIILDAFRLPHRLFRSTKRPIIQVLWGDPARALGDSAGYWDYLSKNPVSLSIVMRQSQFNRLIPLQTTDLSMTSHESLRTIKVKQAHAAARLLPSVIQKIYNSPIQSAVEERIVQTRLFYAPTLWTYLWRRPRTHRHLPAYACREQPFTLLSSSL